MFCEFDATAVARARRTVGEIASPFHGGRTVEDARLVVSELVTNALEHGAPGAVVLDVDVTSDGVTVRVTSHGDAAGFPDVADWSLPGVEATTGRGLAVTRAVCDRVDVATVPSAAPGHDLIAITARVVPEVR